jgi:putative Mg2+ transporter-C (MgtC) family protein
MLTAVTSCTPRIGILDPHYRAIDPSLSSDPAKVMRGVMTGIGFMGAGAFFREKRHVEGAGSAASVWAASVWAAGAIGIVCGLGFLWLGALVATLVVATLVVATLLASRPFVSGYAERVNGDGQE